jgi:hypothetical protein
MPFTPWKGQNRLQLAWLRDARFGCPTGTHLRTLWDTVSSFFGPLLSARSELAVNGDDEHYPYSPSSDVCDSLLPFSRSVAVQQ